MLHKTLLTSLVLAAISPSVTAADNNKLDTVVVSATRSEQSNATLPANISVISKQDIEFSGASTLAEILRGKAGIQVRELVGDGTGMVVSMRGFGSTAGSNTLLLIDGRRMNNPDLAAPEFSSIHIKDIERIEIIQGSAGSLFGDQAVGGVINVITRTPTKLNAYAKLTASSYNNNSISAGISDKLDNGISYRLSAVTRSADNYRDINDVDYENILGRVDYEFGKGKVFFEYQDINEDAQRPGGLFSADFDVDRRAPRFLTDYADTDTNSARIGLSYALSDNWQLDAELTNRNTDVIGKLSGFDFVQERDVEEFTPRFIGSFNTTHGESLVTVGIDIINSSYYLESPLGLTTNDQNVSNLYGQAVIPVSDKLTATIGARSALVENDLTSSCGGFCKFPNGIDINDSQTVFEAGLSIQLSPEWRAFLRRDENFRFAKLDEHTSTLAGIVDLKTQTGISWELGTEWVHNDKRISANLFQLHLKNEIDYDPVNFANINLDPTVRHGLTLEANWKANRNLNLAAQYSYIDAKFDKGAFKGNDIPFVAENTASLSANYKLSANWSLFGEAQYISNRYAAGDSNNAFDKLDGYTLMNVNLNYKRNNWLAALRINNLANKKYSDYSVTAYNADIGAFGATDIAFYAAPERNMTISLQYSY